jgi:hypothetical protein
MRNFMRKGNVCWNFYQNGRPVNNEVHTKTEVIKFIIICPGTKWMTPSAVNNVA